MTGEIKTRIRRKRRWREEERLEEEWRMSKMENNGGECKGKKEVARR